MGRAGYSTQGSLSFLLVLNGGAVVAALLASRLADRFGPKMVVVASFLLGAVGLLLLTVDAPLALLLLFVAVVGAGTSGTQILIYGFVANYYRPNVRGAGVAWCAGFGRLGGVAGPLVGGLLVAAGLGLEAIFYVLTGLAAFGALLTLLVPVARRGAAVTAVPVEPTAAPRPSAGR
jgi:AAHS family benzoate transporter-like MFS transporter